MRSMLAVAVAGLLAAAASAETIKGEYLEARNADVWTGPCFANAEIGIVGNKAVLAWKVTEGIYQDVRLDGLGVAAVVIGDRTFGIGEAVRTRTVFLVDEKASDTQRRALVAMASELAGETIQDVVGVRAVPFAMETAYCNGAGCARLEAGQARIHTRCMSHKDCICGHEEIAYPVLSRTTGEYAAYTLQNEYSGRDLGETFRDSNARSAIIANFGL